MLAIIASLLLSGAAHINANTPLTPRSYVGEECGVSYPSTERLECGVREYNSCLDSSCPGYLPAKTFETRAEGFCRNPRGCEAEQRNMASRACARPNPSRGPGRLISFWEDGGGQLGVSCQSSEVIKSCQTQSCGPKAFNSCLDHSKPMNNTCTLLMNRVELEDYIGAVRAEVESNARLYAIYKANFLVQAKDKLESGCFIKKFDGNDQYAEVVDALKFRFEETYREVYNPASFACDSTVNISEELNFGDLKCSAISEADVLKKLDDGTLDNGSQRFYGNCLAQKAYQAPETWFRFNLTEINRLLGDVVAAKDESMAQNLRDLKADMDAKKVAKAEGE